VVEFNENKLCRICTSNLQDAFDAVVIKKYTAKILYCPNCGLLQVANPTWVGKAYLEVIALSDTGLVMRNVGLSKKLIPLLFHLFGNGGRYVDFAGGTGLLVRLMRDAGHDFYWDDPYCMNVHARGFEFVADSSSYNVVTAFEVLEHILDPIDFFSNAINKTHTGILIFSTELYEGIPPKPEEWEYYNFDEGQHISFYQKKTLIFIADKLGLKYNSLGQLHIFYQDKYTDLFTGYFNSRLIRKIANYKAIGGLKSKTMSDSLMLRGKGK